MPEVCSGGFPHSDISGSRSVLQAFTYGAFTLCGRLFQSRSAKMSTTDRRRSYYPGPAVTDPVWALARSLATTGAIIGLFSLPPGTEMFQFPGFASRLAGYRTSTVGCPIRRSADQRIFAPSRSLSQLITSFFASESQGILHVPFSPFFMTLVFNRFEHHAARSLKLFSLVV